MGLVKKWYSESVDRIVWRSVKNNNVKSDLCERLDEMSDLSAIREAQELEGNTPCFGADKPLVHDINDPRRCGEMGCLWKQYCDLFRSNDIQLLEKVFSKRNDLETVRNRILSSIAPESKLIDRNTVGLKFRSLNALDVASRKLLLASPSNVISEVSDSSNNLKPYIVDCVLSYSGGGGHAGGHTNLHWKVMFSQDLVRIDSWISKVQKFIDSGNIGYLPPTTVLSASSRYINPSIMGSSEIVADLPTPTCWDIETFDAPHYALPDGDIMINNAEITPILNINLPVIENTSFDTLHQLMADYPEELGAFRDFFIKNVEDIRWASVSSEEFMKVCRKTEIAIRDQIRKLESDHKKARLKAVFDTTGAAIASWTLAIYCIVKGESGLLSYLGPGGILYKFSKDYLAYLNKEISLKDNPAYILWRIGQTK